MESTYDKLRYSAELGECNKWDFSRYTPHVVIMALGQNDSHPIDYINKKEDTQDDTQEKFYIVKQNDTLSKIANMYNTTYQKLADYNNIKNPDLIFVGQKIMIPSNCNKITYIVKSGDTLSSIANDYNTTWQKLYKDNIVVIGDNPNLIYPGQKLTISR